IHKDSRGRVWLASFYFRLAEYIPDQNRVAIFEEDPYNPYGFKGNEAECVFEDNRNNIWTGTSSNGVFHFNPQHNAVRFHVGNDFKPGALQQAAVRFITEIDSNRLFIGTSDGPSIYDKFTDTHTNYKGISTFHKNAALEAVQIGIPDQDKMHFWMGTNRLGLSKYHLKTGSFKNYNRSSKPFPLREDGITDLLQLDDGNIFLIGFGTPAMFNPKTTFYTSFRNDSGGIFKLRNVQTASF